MPACGECRISQVATEEAVETVRRLFREYAAELGVDLCFRALEAELRELPGDYAPPGGRLLLARVHIEGEPDHVVGCVALRRLADQVCEMKRLYVRPAGRGLGVGRRLVERVMQEACEAGYTRCRLDTLPSMRTAIGLYERLGFRDIPPYRPDPVPGARHLELALR